MINTVRALTSRNAARTGRSPPAGARPSPASSLSVVWLAVRSLRNRAVAAGPGDQHPCGAGRDRGAGRTMAIAAPARPVSATRPDGRRRDPELSPREPPPGCAHVIVNRVTQPVLRLVVPHDQRWRHASHPRGIADGHGVGPLTAKSRCGLSRVTARE
jgi:hypothetical protein